MLLQFVIYVCAWISWAHIYEYLVLLCKIGCDTFFMVYGSEVVLPTNLDYGAPRIRAYDEQGADAL